MTDLNLVIKTFQQALESGRAGQPVAGRLMIRHSADGWPIDRQLASAAEAAADLFQDDLLSMSVAGSRDSKRLDALLRFAGGQSMLVSADGGGSGGYEAIVFCSRGTLCWEPGDDAGPAESVESGPRDERWLDEVRRRLPEGSPARAGSTVGAVAASAPKRSGRPPYGLLLVSGDHTHQPGYAEGLTADRRCRLVGVTDAADVNSQRRRLNEQLASRLGIPCLPDLDQALAREDVQVVSVCAEPYRRGELAVRAARAGKHLYLDKPLCGSLADADAIVEAVRGAGVVADMFSQVHWHPALRVRDMLASGRLGRLKSIHMDLCFAKGQAGTARLGTPRVEQPRPSRYELSDSKRELTNVGVYSLAMFLWLLDRSVVRVHACTGNYSFREHQANDMEDFGQMLLEMDDGLIASVSAGRTGWQSHPSGGVNRTYLVGTEGSAVIDAQRPRVEVWSDAPAWKPPPRDPDDPMGMWAPLPESPYRAAPKQDWISPWLPSWREDAQHFLDCIEQGRQSDVPVELAAATTEILLAAYESAAKGGEPVELPLPR